MSVIAQQAGPGKETVGQAEATNGTKQEAMREPAPNGDWAAGLHQDAPPAQSSGAEGGEDQGGKPPEADGKDDGKGILPDGPDAAEKADDKPAEGQEGQGEDKPLELAFPDGFERDDTVLAAFREVAKDAKLNQEGAQKLMDFYHQQLLASRQRTFDEFKAIREQVDRQFRTALHADPELGGANFERNCNHVQATVRRFLNDAEYKEYNTLVTEANIRNARPIFRLLSRIGKYFAEAGPVGGDAAGAPAEPKSIADRMYPNLPSGKR